MESLNFADDVSDRGIDGIQRRENDISVEFGRVSDHRSMLTNLWSLVSPSFCLLNIFCTAVLYALVSLSNLLRSNIKS